MEGCILFMGSILGGIVNFVLYSIAIFLITEPFVEDGTKKYNGLVMTYRPSYEQYVYRLTGLKGKADAHEITPLAPIIGGADGKVVTFSLNESEAQELVKRLGLKENGVCSLSSWTHLINYDKCRWEYNRERKEWMSYHICIDTADLEKIIGKIENEGGVENWKGYNITFLFNKRIDKGILLIWMRFLSCRHPASHAEKMSVPGTKSGNSFRDVAPGVK